MTEINKSVYNIIDILEQFFMHPYGEQFTLFVWGSNKSKISQADVEGNNNDILELTYHYYLKIEDQAIYSGKTAYLFDDIIFNKKFMDVESAYALSDKITAKINQINISCLSQTEVYAYKGLFSGMTFYYDSWKETVNKVFGPECLMLFYKQKLYNNLQQELGEDKPNNQRQKV